MIHRHNFLEIILLNSQSSVHISIVDLPASQAHCNFFTWRNLGVKLRKENGSIWSLWFHCVTIVQCWMLLFMCYSHFEMNICLKHQIDVWPKPIWGSLQFAALRVQSFLRWPIKLFLFIYFLFYLSRLFTHFWIMCQAE